MRTITLLRHAKSSWDNTDLVDFDRPLNGRGRKNAPEMARRLKAAGVRPSLILSSPAKRAWSTAKIIAAEISYPIEFLQRDRDLYHAGTQRLLDILAAQDEGFKNILLVAHNPGLTDLANELVPGLTNNLPTCGFVAVKVEVDTWDLRARKSAELIEYNYPKKST